MSLVKREIRTAKGDKHEVNDVIGSLKKLERLVMAPGSSTADKSMFMDSFQEQINILIKSSEEAKAKSEKIQSENRKLHSNMVKLLKRIEKLEAGSSAASIPEF